MTSILPFIIAGLAPGAVYGLVGVGLVLTYKTTRVFNFAEGSLATVSAYVFYTLHVQHGMAWPLAAVIAVFVVGAVLAVLLERIARIVSGLDLPLQALATIGIVLIIQAVITLTYGITQVRIVPTFLGTGVFQLGSVSIQYSNLVTFIFACVATAALFIFFKTTRLGLAMRAVIEDPTLLDLEGTSVVVVRRWAWLIGASLACVSGVFFASLLPLDPTELTLLVVQAFGAAAIGAFTNLPLTFAGGLFIGIAASLATKWLTSGLLAGIPPSLPFIVLFLVVVLFPRRWLTPQVAFVKRRRPAWVTPNPIQITGGIVVLIFLIGVPFFAGVDLNGWTSTLGTVILFLSLGLLVRTAGQVSLGQIGFAAVGVTAFSHLITGGHLPWGIALIGAGLIAVPIGAVLAIPASRLPGLYLALATFGFGVLLQSMFYTQNFMFGTGDLGLTMPRPSGFTSDKGYYYLVLVIVVATSAVFLWLERGRLGKLLQAVGDSPRALATNGTTVNVTRVLVFCITAFAAAIGGALVGGAQGSVSPISYQPISSLTYFAVALIVVGGAPWYALVGAAGLVLFPLYVTNQYTNDWLLLVFGVSALVHALTVGQREVPLGLRRALEAFSLPGRRRKEAPAPSPRTVAGEPVKVSQSSLEVRGLSVRFGGLVAVDGIDLKVSTGQISGLIGPNGAGKTTTFNAYSGLIRPTAGKFVINGLDVSGLSVAARAPAVGRTFQIMEIFDSMSVYENVALGREGQCAGSNPLRHLVGGRQERKDIHDATWSALDLCGIAALSDAVAGVLSTGQRRLVELARCLAGPYEILLLDEPSSGLDRVETERFGQILLNVVASRGVGVLLVEHDMSLVMEICDYIHVLDFGRMLFEGTPAEVRSSRIVQEAYLGSGDIVSVVGGAASIASDGALVEGQL